MKTKHSVSKGLLPIVALLASLIAFPVTAQEFEGLYAWLAPTAEEQLAADATAIPAGDGAIFVPAMSSGADEPEVLVYSGDKRVASGRTGQRILVAPGSYDVRTGSGAVLQTVSTPVTVTAGTTTSVTPTWSGLRVHVVDTQNLPLRSTYDLIRAEDREVMGTGFGVDTLQAEPLQTWLLRPGLYRIVRTGDTFRARRDFATAYLPEGGLVHFKLVLDPETGDFRGAGVVTADEIGIRTAASDSNWNHTVTLSGAASLSSTDNLVGRPNQSSVAATAFVDAYSTYENGPHAISNILEIEEGFLQVDPDIGPKLPTQQTQDRFREDLLYTRYINERWGPYARFGLLTNLFDAETLAVEPITIVYNRLDGTQEIVSVPANGTYKTADALGSLRFKEGVGINVRLFRNQIATINWRGGVGFRQSQFNGAFVENDLVTTPEIDFFELDDINQEGLETTLLASVRLARRLSYITDLEVFADFDDTGNPTIDWRNTLSFRLTRFLSLDYTYDLLDFPQVSDKKQTRQNLLLRASFDIF